MRAALSAGLFTASLLGMTAGAGDASAQPAPRAVVAPPSSSAGGPSAGAGAQRALAVDVADGAVVAAVCPQGAATCAATDGARFVPPESARAAVASAAVRAVSVGAGHHVVVVEARADAARWWLVLAAPPSGEGAPRVVWTGWTDRAFGEPGDQREHRLVVGTGRGASRLELSTRRDDLSLCGRGAWTSQRALDPASLELRPVPSLDPIAQSRTGASAPNDVQAIPVAAGEPTGSAARVLSPLAGSRPGFPVIADGDPATAWAPEVAGDATFETVTFVAAPELPITSIDLRLVPPPGKDRASARGVIVATADRLVRLRVPTEPVPAGGVVLRATLPSPIAARCVAILLEAPAGRGAPAALVAEVAARTAFDAMTLEQIARGLGGEGGAPRAAFLVRAGGPGLDAALAAYPALDPPGQDMARRVIDAAPCDKKVALFVGQLVDADPDVARRALDRVTRCGEVAAAPILARLEAAPPDRPDQIATYADALGLAAPELAVPELARRIGAAQDDTIRAALRAALTRAARRKRAAGALQLVFAPDTFATLPDVARVDVLRAAASQLTSVRGGAELLASFTTEKADFRTRYLLAPAAAELARGGDPAARAWLERTMATDPDPRLRARAVRAASRAPAALTAIARAAGDAEPRVREAAATALAVIGDAAGAGPRPAAFEVSQALARGVGDEWTFVRETAAGAAAAWPSEPRADAAIARVAAADPVPRVRMVALHALGARGAVAHLDLVRARAGDRAEDLDVRAEGYRALGALCDRASLGALTDLAVRAAAPFSEADRKLGGAAIDALAALRPPDLEARLALLRSPDAPREARERVVRALAEPGRCR